jgi:hypothetical protein
MFRVFFLIFEPGVAWERIAQKPRGYAFILKTYLLPFILLATAVEGWGLATYGKWQPTYHSIHSFGIWAVVCFEFIQALLFVAMVFVSALILQISAESFHGRRSFLQVFTTVAYGYSPFFLVHLLNAMPGINPLYPWLVGIALTVWILYQGIPRVLKPDPTHAFGNYLSAVFVVVLISGVARLFTGLYVLGYIHFKHSS